MHPKKLDNVFNLPPRERFEYFIKHVADLEMIWGLKQDESKEVLKFNLTGRT